MKKIHIVAYVFALLVCIGCKTQELVTCEEVRKTSDLPWLEAIVQKGVSWEGQKLLNIDKITYTTDDSNTSQVGYEVKYEFRCCDIPDIYIYNCNGEMITSYGGIWGCNGVCDLNIIARKNLYSAE